MRLCGLSFFLVLVLLPPFAAANAEDFGGVWVAALCPSGVQRASGKCSNFVLELHQKDGRLCGAHFFANGDASETDEGGAPSLTGEIDGNAAQVVAVSTRGAAPVRLQVEMKKLNGALHWKRLDEPAGNYLLPQTARLSKSARKTMFAPLFEQQLRATCLSAFAAADRAAAPPPPPEAPAREQQAPVD